MQCTSYGKNERIARRKGTGRSPFRPRDRLRFGLHPISTWRSGAAVRAWTSRLRAQCPPAHALAGCSAGRLRLRLNASFGRMNAIGYIWREYFVANIRFPALFTKPVTPMTSSSRTREASSKSSLSVFRMRTEKEPVGSSRDNILWPLFVLNQMPSHPDYRYFFRIPVPFTTKASSSS